MSQFNINGSFTNGTPINVIVEDENIYQYDYYNNAKNQVGVTVLKHKTLKEEYESLQTITTEYYNKLVELGEIIPEKTQEEILQETQEALKQTQEALQKSQEMNKEMYEILKEMKGSVKDDTTSNTKPSGKNVSDQTKRNTASDKPSDTSDAGGK